MKSSAALKTAGLASLSAFLALPWCCIAPALLSTVGLSVAGLGWLVGFRHVWIFLAPSLGALGWSLHMTVVKRQGSAVSRVLSLGISLATTSLWMWRFYA